jgi:hypothetical protein
MAGIGVCYYLSTRHFVYLIAASASVGILVIIVRSAVRDLVSLDRTERAAWNKPEDQEKE